MNYKAKKISSSSSCSMKQKGFTLVELIVSVSLFLIVSLFLGYLVTYQFLIYNTQITELNITHDARTALDDIDDYVRQSNRVVANYDSYTTGSQILVLQIKSIDSSNQLIGATYDNVVFYSSGSDLFRQVFPNSHSSRLAVTKKLATNVDTNNFSFSYDNLDYFLVKQITTSMAIKQNVGNKIKSITLYSQTKLRNY